MLESVFLSASTFLRVFGGIFLKASFVGANTVRFWAELRVSTRPAFLTAVTSVDRTGLLDAAVATGSADMPEKLPLPLLGTAEQPAPKGLSGMAGEAGGAAPPAAAERPARRGWSGRAAEPVVAPPAAGAEDEAALSSLLLSPPQAAPL